MDLKTLRERQQWTLPQKIDHSLGVIDQFASHFDGQVYVSFSGGKDSEANGLITNFRIAVRSHEKGISRPKSASMLTSGALFFLQALLFPNPLYLYISVNTDFSENVRVKPPINNIIGIEHCTDIMRIAIYTLTDE